MILALALIAALQAGPFSASCDASVELGTDIAIGIGCQSPSQGNPGNGGGGSGPPPPPVFPVRCDSAGNCLLNPPLDCPDGETGRYLWALNPDGSHRLVSAQCLSDAEPLPVVTPGMVLEELRRVGLPPLTVQSQPSGTTLVNLDTRFSTEPRPVERTLVILGQRVQVRAEAARFVFIFGDGVTVSASHSGEQRPILHRYAQTGRQLKIAVDTMYGGEFRLSGGPWRNIPGTVTIDGPREGLTVAEATPVLTGDR